MVLWRNVVRVYLWVEGTLVNGNGMRICEMWQKQTLLLRPLQRRESSQKWQIPNYPTTLIKHVILSLMLFVLFVHSSPLSLTLFSFIFYLFILLSTFSIYIVLFSALLCYYFICLSPVSFGTSYKLIIHYSCYKNQYFYQKHRPILNMNFKWLLHKSILAAHCYIKIQFYHLFKSKIFKNWYN